MADISQITLPDGTTYDIKDPVARAAAGDAGAGKIFYGVCSTGASTQTKVVTIDDFELFTGALIAVKFDNVNTATAPKLNISGTGAINMYSVGTTAVLPNAWVAGETLLFVYNGTSYMVADGGIASTSGYGATKLNSSTSSTSTTEAATPSAVKSAYDLALEAKTSASDGKSLIASAITGKGVSTSATDTFATMADNIDNIQTGHMITVNGEEYDNDIDLIYENSIFKVYSDQYFSTSLDSEYKYVSYVYDGEIHMYRVGTPTSTSNTVYNHYYYSQGVWNHDNSFAICANSVSVPIGDYMYFLRLANSSATNLRVVRVRGGTMTIINDDTSNYLDITTLISGYPYPYYIGSPSTYNGKIYIQLGVRNKTSGSSISYRYCVVSFDPENINDGFTIIKTNITSSLTNYICFTCNNNTYALGANYTNVPLYSADLDTYTFTQIKYTGFGLYSHYLFATAWSLYGSNQVVTPRPVEYDGKAYIVAVGNTGSYAGNRIFTFDGTRLVEIESLPATDYNRNFAVVYEDKLLVGGTSYFNKLVYTYTIS